MWAHFYIGHVSSERLLTAINPVGYVVFERPDFAGEVDLREQPRVIAVAAIHKAVVDVHQRNRIDRITGTA